MLIDFRQLFPKYNIKPKGVLHVGANVGEEAPVYLELGIKKQIWIEADPVIFQRLKLRLEDNPEAYPLNYCISDGEEVNFHVANNGGQSSSILELGTHLVAHPEVNYIRDVPMRTATLQNCLYAFQYNGRQLKDYNFLNLDLQGNELRALKGLGKWIENISWIYTEVNKAELYKGCPMVEDLDYYLAPLGFRRVETQWCGRTNWGDALYIR